MSGIVNYYIYNSQGKLLMNGLLPNAGIQSVKNIQIAEPGVYLVVIKNEKSVFSKKLIIQ
ncbi:MAG: T9SS type A sorting domain-containing protein [Saprospiraceae bacterium]|nr:T9SS type A sorting domain-containing protein [Saprospiraceae bacterium]